VWETLLKFKALAAIGPLTSDVILRRRFVSAWRFSRNVSVAHGTPRLDHFHICGRVGNPAQCMQIDTENPKCYEYLHILTGE
jgi:hypothetical protein